ncbi:PREDICTED: uncharacterized protein LOC108567004 [Nicrophorus vespilloides]|uniref:Uncharacterized protein LOC108567004 n=1 Tax=Nicrophorus vespilloides TaxID=110193 RepID=A0ABM1N768_NICVS|nr:PREDICTED: uncharacterized protein LOC108567004 [Nicrophorus vespilloides]
MTVKTQLLYRIFEPFILYGLIKLLTKKYGRFNQFVAMFVGMVLFLPFFYTCMVVLKIYKLFVGLLLRIRHGNKFVCFMHGCDTIFSLESITKKATINVVYLFDFQGTSEEFFKIASQKICDFYNEDVKIRCVRCTFLGYSYFIEHPLDKDELIKKMDSKNGNFQDHMKELDKMKFPVNDTGLIQFGVGNDKVESKTGIWCYPIYAKIHHSMGDGISMLRGLQLVSHKPKKITKLINVNPMRLYLESFWTCMKSPVMNNLEALYPTENTFTQKLVGEKNYTVWADKTSDTLDKMKEIRNRLNDGTTTTAIICTALSKALEDYLDSRKMQKPRELGMTLTQLTNFAKCSYTNYTNAFSPCEIKIPIDFDGNMLDRLKIMRDFFIKFPSTLDMKIGDWYNKTLFPLLPNALTKSIYVKGIHTVSMSNMPGLKEEIKILESTKLEAFHYWIPNPGNAGFNICFYSYRNRFNMGLSVDEAFISDVDELSNLCNATINNIMNIYKQCINS